VTTGREETGMATDLEDATAAQTADKDGRLAQWAQGLSADARLFVKLLPFGGHVRLRPQAYVPENPNNPPPAAPATSGMSTWWASGEDPDAIEGFTLDADHFVKFLRASGAGRQESRDRTTAALTELMLQGLVRVYRDDDGDENEATRYALTETGHRVQQVLP